VTTSGESHLRWRYVVGAFFGIAGGFGSLYFYSAGVFMKPLSDEFGWSRGEVSLGAVAISLGNLIAVPVAGRIIDGIDGIGAVLPGIASMLALRASFVLLSWFTAGPLSLCR
jgi:hypothetical protein